MTYFNSTPDRRLTSPEEAEKALRRNKDQASKRAKRGWATRKRNERALNRMIADAVERDDR